MTAPAIKIAFGFMLLKKRAACLVPLMPTWGKVIHRYCKAAQGEVDAPYWYNERANISLLAAAAWLTPGALALEEYSSIKGEGNDSASGRTDLFVEFSHGGNLTSVEVEAKHQWAKAARTDQQLKVGVERSMGLAVRDAQRVNAADRRFGCTFFVIQFSERRFKDYEANADAYVRAEIERYFLLKVADLWAWSFPPYTRHLREEPEGRYYYPGIILGFRHVKSSMM